MLTAAANLLLLIYVVAGFAGAPFAAWLANRISKHIAFLVTTTLYSLGLMCLPFLPKGDFPVFSVLMFLVGATAGAIFLTFNVLAMVGYQVGAGATNTPEAIRGLEERR